LQILEIGDLDIAGCQVLNVCLKGFRGCLSLGRESITVWFEVCRVPFFVDDA
jgi:hypothetical protein